MYCPECGKESASEYVCTNCGLVFEDKPITNQPPISPESEVIRGGKFRSKYLKDLLSPTKINLKHVNDDMKRILKKNTPFWDLKRTLIIHNEIKRLCCLLNLNKNVEISCVYYLNKIKSKSKELGFSLFKKGGSSLEKIAHAIVFLVARVEDLPLTLYDFERIGLDKKEVYKQYSRLKRDLKIRFKPTDASVYINKILKQLDLQIRDESLLSLCATSFIMKVGVLEELTTHPLGFRNQIVKTAAVIYMLGGSVYRITQKEICNIVGCNTHALRNRIEEIKDLLYKVGKIRFEDKHWRKFNKEYKPFIDNMSKILERPKYFISGLVDLKYQMEITKAFKGIIELEFKDAS